MMVMIEVSCLSSIWLHLSDEYIDPMQSTSSLSASTNIGQRLIIKDSRNKGGSTLDNLHS